LNAALGFHRTTSVDRHPWDPPDRLHGR
jgi:hypothetical protein